PRMRAGSTPVSADTVRTLVDLAQPACRPKRGLYRAIELELERNVAKLAVRGARQGLQGRAAVGRGAAARTHQIPAELEQAGSHALQAEREQGAARHLPAIGELERTNA